MFGWPVPALSSAWPCCFITLLVRGGPSASVQHTANTICSTCRCCSFLPDRGDCVRRAYSGAVAGPEQRFAGQQPGCYRRDGADVAVAIEKEKSNAKHFFIQGQTMNPRLTDLWVYLAASPLLGLTLTLLAYQVALWFHQRCRFHPLANPVLVAIALVSAVLLATDMDYPSILTVPSCTFYSAGHGRPGHSVVCPVVASAGHGYALAHRLGCGVFDGCDFGLGGGGCPGGQSRQPDVLGSKKCHHPDRHGRGANPGWVACAGCSAGGVVWSVRGHLCPQPVPVAGHPR